MNRLQILAIGIGIVVVFGILYYSLTHKTPDENGNAVSVVQSLTPAEPQEKLFAASLGETGSEIQIVLFDSRNKEVLLSKTIIAREQISDNNRYNWSGANDAVQFNPQSNEVFYLTQGAASYDGSCINSDGTCADRIYKANLQTNEQSILFEINFEDEDNDNLENWILLPKENALLMSLYSYSSETQRFVKINLADGGVIWNRCCEHFWETRVGRDALILSGNAQEAYQIGYTLPAPGAIALKTINIRTGATSVHDLYSGGSVDAQSSGISPDGKLLAFHEDERVKLYDFSSNSVKEIFAGALGNHNLLWSGDNRLIIERAGGWVLYDVEKATTEPMPERGSNNVGADLAAPSNKYVIFSNLFAGIFPRMLDLQTDQIIDLPIKGTTMVGISWY